MARSSVSNRQKVRDMGTCLNFNGTSDVAVSALWGSSQIYSMGAWFKSGNYKKNQQVIVSNGIGGAGRGQALVLSGNATTDGSIFLLNHVIAWIDLGFKVQDNNWHHIFMTTTGSVASTKVYLDGVVRYSGSPVLNPPSTSSAFGGDGNNTWFKGKVDEVRYYSSELSANDVLNLFYGNDINTTVNNYYKMDEGSGSAALDSGTSPKNATITGANYSSDVFLKSRTIRNFGYSLKFSQSTDIVISSSLWSTGNTSFTIMAWFKTNNYSQSNQTIFSNGDGTPSTGRGIAIILSGNTTTGGTLYILDHVVKWVSTSYSITNNNWHHIALVLDSAGHPSVYVDGDLKYFGGAVTTSAPNGKSYIGNALNTNFNLNGFVKKVAFYPFELNANQVYSEYSNYSKPITAKNYYEFTEGTGSTTTDSISGNDGTITSATYSDNIFFPSYINKFPHIASGLYMVGDSITFGTGASSAPFAYSTLVSLYQEWQLTNGGVAGDMVPDMQARVFQRTVLNKSQSTFLIGYNEMRQYGTDATNLGYFLDGAYSAVGFMALPVTNKYLGQSSLISYSGTWSNYSGYGGSVGKQSSSNGDTATFVLKGSTIYINALAIKSGTGQFSLSVDGVSQGTFNCYGSNTTHNAINDHTFMIRIPGLLDAPHTVVLTVIGTGTVTLIWAGGNSGINAFNQPNVYVGNCLRQTATGYVTGVQNSGSDAATVLYSNNVATVVSNLSSDGLGVTIVDVNTNFPPITANFAVDDLHPSDAGHRIIANIFNSVVINYYNRIRAQ